MGLLIVKWLSSSVKVAAVAARRLDRLKVLEVELDHGLQLVGQARSFEVVWDVVEPGAVFVLQTDQGGHRCSPAGWLRGDAPDRCRGRPGNLLAQLGAAPGLARGRAHRDRTNAMSGHAEFSIVNRQSRFPE
jgi:hypothetical protein